MTVGPVHDGEARLWVVCPSYTDIPAFTLLRQRILEVLADSPELRGYAVRFVIVDDTGGYDDDVDTIAFLDDVRVVTPPYNVGHQRALVCGLRVVAPDLADDDLVVTMDADGEDRPEDLPRMVRPLLDAPTERKRLCVARRTERQESLGFKVMYFFFRNLFRTLTGVSIRNGNYAAYRGWLARRMLHHPYFDLCYSSTLVSLDLPVTAVPCARGTRYAGQSRMNLLRLFMHGVRMLMPFTDRIAARALSAFALLFGGSVALGAVVVGLRIGGVAIPGWLTFCLIGLLVGSFLALGNFVVLFAVFSYTRAIAMSTLEDSLDGAARGRPGTSPREVVGPTPVTRRYLPRRVGEGRQLRS